MNLICRSAGKVVGLTASALFAIGCSSHPDGPKPPDTPVELTIQYIQRLPEIDWVPASTNPKVEGWPAVGQQVTWRASVKNWGSTDLVVPYRWLLDGTQVAKGSVKIGAGATGTADYPWTWTFDRHRVTFQVDPDGTIPEEDEGNNSLEVVTNALSVGFYVEQKFYDYMRSVQPKLVGAHSTSFEDWAQRQITRYNLLFEKAIYPETPQGVLDRYRLDKITIVPDGALPLDPGAHADFDPTQAIPNVGDHSVDIEWGFPSKYIDNYSLNGFAVNDDNQLYYSGFVQHETGHARYLVDVYTWDVYDGITWERVDIMEGGERVAGSRFMPGKPASFNGVSGVLLHKADFQGLMNADWTYIDRYSAVMFNRIAGRRATFGNFNAPKNFGEFLDEMPADNVVTVEDAQGTIIPNAKISVYRAGPFPGGQPSNGQWVQYFDNTPDMQLSTDASGNVHLGRNPFTDSGPVVIDQSTFLRGVIIVRVEAGGKVGYGFLESSEFNMAYERGQTSLANYELKVNMLN